MPETIRLGPLDLAPLDMAETVAWVLDASRAGRSCLVVTSNIHHLRLASDDPAFHRVVAGAELNVADGWPLVAASRLRPGMSLPGRIAGVDLVDAILREGGSLRVALLGGPPGAAGRLAALLSELHEIVLVDELPKGSWEGEAQLAALAQRLESARPNLTLIGIGAPQQELLGDMLRPAVAGPIVCCGATLEFLAGVRARAPRRLQAIGLEWAFRLLLEPRRLGPRYARAGYAFLKVVARRSGTG